MIYICHIFIYGEAGVSVLAVGDDELDVGNDELCRPKSRGSEVAEGMTREALALSKLL
jgi:hypothetical protein